MYKVVFAAFALLLTAYVSPSFAEKKKVASPPDHVSEGCTDKIMCCIPGKGCFDPNTRRDTAAITVTRRWCRRVKNPARRTRPSTGLNQAASVSGLPLPQGLLMPQGLFAGIVLATTRSDKWGRCYVGPQIISRTSKTTPMQARNTNPRRTNFIMSLFRGSPQLVHGLNIRSERTGVPHLSQNSVAIHFSNHAASKEHCHPAEGRPR